MPYRFRMFQKFILASDEQNAKQSFAFYPSEAKRIEMSRCLQRINKTISVLLMRRSLPRGVFIFLSALVLGFSGVAFFAHAAGNLSGYAWADDGIGWVSFNCSNAGVCGASNYGVTVAQNGTMSGYGWANPNDGSQNHIGWINFNPSGPYPNSSFVPNQPVRMNPGTGEVRGWARAVNYDLAGGWDGWIGFGSGGSYGSGVAVSGCAWSGYAWGGGTVIGWIHFAGSGYGVTGTGDGCAGGTTIVVNATLNGVSWAGSVNYSLSGMSSYSGTSVMQTLSNRPAGSYTLTYTSGGPAGATLTNITPSATQTLATGGTITFTMNFNVPPPPPMSPSATTAPNNACKVINVLWTNSPGATGYNINRCSASCVPVAANWPSTPFQDASASDGIAYTYQISACNEFGCSSPAITSSITNNAPEAGFGYTPSSNIIINQLVKFAGQLIGGSATTSQSWTFAGGNPASSASPSPSSSFSTSGSHAVTYTANNASGSCVVSGAVSVSQNTFGDWCELPPDAPPGTPCP